MSVEEIAETVQEMGELFEALQPQVAEMVEKERRIEEMRDGLKAGEYPHDAESMEYYFLNLLKCGAAHLDGQDLLIVAAESATIIRGLRETIQWHERWDRNLKHERGRLGRALDLAAEELRGFYVEKYKLHPETPAIAIRQDLENQERKQREEWLNKPS